MKPAADHADKLARADRDIARIEGRIVQQLAFIERLDARGHDADLAQAALRVLEFDLEVLRRQRRFLLGDPDVPACRPRPPARVHRPRRATDSPRPDERGRESPRPEGVAAAGPMLTWESLPNRALIARTEDHLLVVRPTDAKGRAFRFAVLKPLPANGGLLPITAGNAHTAREAMLAAERAIAPPGPAVADPLAPHAPEAGGGDGRRVPTPPDSRSPHPAATAEREEVEAPPSA